jgi:hypothetical protein
LLSDDEKDTIINAFKELNSKIDTLYYLYSGLLFVNILIVVGVIK